MIILSTITINIAIGENGLIEKAKLQAVKRQMEELYKEVTLKVQDKQKNEYLGTMVDGDTFKEQYLETIPEVTVIPERLDTWYVERNEAVVTVYEDGEVLEGKIEPWDGTSEVPGKGKNNEFKWEIYNAKQFKFFADFVNNGNTLTSEQENLIITANYSTEAVKIDDNTIVYLMDNIDLGARADENGNWEGNTDVQWTPIGLSNAGKFIGTFEGNGHTIRGSYVSITDNFAGIFGNSDTIQNLTVKNSYIKTHRNYCRRNSRSIKRRGCNKLS